MVPHAHASYGSPGACMQARAVARMRDDSVHLQPMSVCQVHGACPVAEPRTAVHRSLNHASLQVQHTLLNLHFQQRSEKLSSDSNVGPRFNRNF